MLPIEFARISQDDRLTLVIHPTSSEQPTYWALSESATLKEARDNLREREKAKSEDIHYVVRNGEAANGAPAEIVTKMSEWLALHAGIDAAVWTGLDSNWPKKRRGRAFTPEDAVKFLLELEGRRDQDVATYNRAREYMANAPAGMNTVVRNAMRKRGWADAQLPVVLFEH